MRYEGHGWDPKGPASIHHARRPRPGWCRARLCLREQGLLARRHRYQRERPELQPRRPIDGVTAEIATGLWCAHRILWLRQQAAGLGDDRPIARPRLAI